MRRILLTMALAAAMLVGGMAWTDTAEARPRGWRYYGGPAVYGGYYGGYYPRYYRYSAPRYYYGPSYYGYYYGPAYYPYSYYGPGVYVGGPGFYFRF